MYRLLVSLLFFTLSACSTTAHGSKHTHIDHSKLHAEYAPYNATSDAWADVREAKLRAQNSNKMTIVAMGANWCHDSRGFAAQFAKPRFQTLLNEHFELVYVDVGKRDRNIDIAREFGVDAIYGTPTVFVLSPSGDVLNLETAPTWRNADSRSEDEIFGYFEDMLND